MHQRRNGPRGRPPRRGQHRHTCHWSGYQGILQKTGIKDLAVMQWSCISIPRRSYRMTVKLYCNSKNYTEILLQKTMYPQSTSRRSYRNGIILKIC